MANFEVFCWNISSIINHLFLKSGVTDRIVLQLIILPFPLYRSPLRYHNGNAEPFILPGYALSPDEDEDSGADSLNEHLGNIEGKKLKNP